MDVLQDQRPPTDQPAPRRAQRREGMTTGLPRSSRLENARFALTYALPSLLRGAVAPQPFWTEVATRLNTGQWAVATVERLSGRHGDRSLLLRGVLGQTLLILTTEDVRRVLDFTVEVFALDAREKQRALEPFAPDALNQSPPSLHAQRRPFNGTVLDYGHEPHRLARRTSRLSARRSRQCSGRPASWTMSDRSQPSVGSAAAACSGTRRPMTPS